MFKRVRSDHIKGRILLGSVVIVCFVFAFWSGHASLTTIPSEEPKNFIVTEPSIDDPSLKIRLRPVPTSKPVDPDTPWIETISWNPRLFLYHNFLTSEECAEIVKLGEESVTRSEVVSKEGSGRVDTYRTSNGVFFTDEWMRGSPLLRDIERRIAEWTHLPVENGEAYYLLRYNEGEYYKPHTDFFGNDEIGQRYIGDWGNRYATVITYLHTPSEGGETEFPQISRTIPAKAGDAILFYDLNPDNEGDPYSEHASLPVTKGTKWAMTKWIREKPFYRWDSQHTVEEKLYYSKEDSDRRLQHYNLII